MRATRLGFVVCAALAALSSASAQQNFWLLNQSGNWENAQNWSLGQPQPTHECFIPFGGITVTLSTANTSVLLIDSDANFNLVGGSIQLTSGANPSDIRGQFLHAGGFLGGPATLNASGPAVWQGGVQGGNGTTRYFGGVTFVGTSMQVQDTRTLSLASIGQWNGGIFQLDPGANFTVAGNGRFAINTPGLFQGGSLGINGIVEKNGSGTAVINSTVTMRGGTIFGNGGVLRFTGQGTYTGQVFAINGIVEFSGGTHDFLSGFTYAGNFAVTGGNMLLQPGSSFQADTLITGGKVRFFSEADFGSGRTQLGPNGTLIVESGLLNQTGPFPNFHADTKELHDGHYVLRPNSILRFPGAEIRKNFAHISLSNAIGRGSGQVQDENGEDGLGHLEENNGTIDVEDDGELNTQESLGNNGTMNCSDGGDVRVSGSMGNNGTMNTGKDGTTTVGTARAGGIYQQNAGTTIVNGTLIATAGVIIEGGILTGEGFIDSRLVGASFINPGFPTGALRVRGPVNFRPRNNLIIELGGKNAGEFDQLVVDGSMVVRGRLDIFKVDGYEPQVGDSFRIISTNGFLLGTFSQVVSHTPGINWVVSKTINGITIKATN